jgi:integrase
MTKAKSAKGREANGRSSIYQSPDGRWHGWVTVGVKADGTPDRRHRTGTTQKAVAEKVHRLERDRDAGTVLDTGRPMKVGEWLTHWVEAIKRPTVRYKTYVGYEVDVRVHLIPHLGGHRLDQLRVEHVEAVFAAMAAAGSSAGTIDHVRRTLRTALNDAMKRGRIGRNPAALATVARGDETEIEPFTAADARHLLDAAMGERNGVAWVIALSMGLRRGEVLGLSWSGFDPTAGTLRVRRALGRRTWRHGCDGAPCGRKRGADCPERHGGGLVFDEPKSKKGRRTLVLPAPLIAALKTQRQQQVAERLAAGTEWHDHDLIFAQPDGTPIDPDGHTKDWNAFLQRAGVRPGRLHDARHTAATLLLVQGVDPRVVLDIMGWSSLSMTTRYQHVVPELMQAAADKIGTALWGPDGTATKTATT